MADSSETQQSEAFTTDMKRMTNLERELFDMHKRQKVAFMVHRNKINNRQINVNLDMMDEDMKQAHKRMRI